MGSNLFITSSRFSILEASSWVIDSIIPSFSEADSPNLDISLLEFSKSLEMPEFSSEVLTFETVSPEHAIIIKTNNMTYYNVLGQYKFKKIYYLFRYYMWTYSFKLTNCKTFIYII